MPVSVFMKAVNITLKINNFEDSKLFDKMKECLLDENCKS